MRKISVVALLLAALLSLTALVSCGEKEEVKAPDGMKLASGEDVDYFMFVPEAWRVDRSDLYTSAYFSSGDATSISVSAYGLTGGVADLDSWWKSFSDEAKTVYGEFNEVESKKAKIDGIEGKEYTFTAKLGETQYNYIVTAVIKDYYVYYVTYTSTPDYFDVHKESIDKIVQEFTFN